MATKDYDLSCGDKSKPSINSFSNFGNNQYNDLNLNGVHQSHVYESSKSNSFKNDEKKLDDFNNTKAKNDLNSFNKNQKSSQNLFPLFTDAVKEEKENRWKKDNDAKKNKSNSSTLSLHISAYENSIEAAAADSNGDKKDGDKGLSKTMKNAKFSLTSSSLKPKTPSPFEMPRQQQDQQSEPEMMQFKASQKLVNPNSTDLSPNPCNDSFLNYELIVEESVPTKSIDADLERLKRIHSMEMELKKFRGTQFGGGGGQLKIDDMRLIIAEIYYENKSVFAEGGNREPEVMQRRIEIWNEICAALTKEEFSFNPVTVRKNFINFINETRQKWREEQDNTGAAAAKYTKAEKYVLLHEEKEEVTTGIPVDDLGCRPVRKNKGKAASRLTYTPQPKKKKGARAVPVFEEELSLPSSEPESDSENEIEIVEETVSNPAPSPSSVRRSQRQRGQSSNFFDNDLASLPGNDSSPTRRSRDFSSYRNPSTRETNAQSPNNGSSETNASTTPDDENSTAKKGIDGPLTSGPPKKSRDSVKEHILRTGQSIKKASELVALNAAKKSKILDEIAETDAKRRKIQLEREEIQLKREQLEYEKTKLELELLKKKK